MVAQESMTAAEYQDYLDKKKRKRKNKYNANKSKTEEHKFDSDLERKEFDNLSWRKQEGDIFDFKHHVPFEVMESKKGKLRTYRKRSYIADFVTYDKDGKIVEVIDTKSPPTRTQLYTLKIHLFYVKYGIEVVEK